MRRAVAGTPNEEPKIEFGCTSIAGHATVALNPLEGCTLRDARFASGVLVRRKQITFVATAGHFLDQVRPDQMTVIFSCESTATVRSGEEARRRATATPD